jgi:dienelactone hydrolase
LDTAKHKFETIQKASADYVSLTSGLGRFHELSLKATNSDEEKFYAICNFCQAYWKIPGFELDSLDGEDEQTSDIKTSNIRANIPGLILNKFNIELLTDRLIAVTDWSKENSITNILKIAYFGTSTGAAASLRSASRLSNVKAVVSRSGRTDLVEKKLLKQLSIPCLFIVGSKDKTVIDLNKKTMARLTSVKDKKLKIIEGATHSFVE